MRAGGEGMLTFAEFVAQIDATLPGPIGAAGIRRVESSSDDVEWRAGEDAVRVVRQSAIGATLIPYRNGRRRGAMAVVPMDALGVEDARAMIAAHLGTSSRATPNA